MTSYIQVRYGYRKVSDPIQFVSPKNNFENKLFDRIGYISNKDDPILKNNILNAIRNREDLQKFILATSDLGNELQEDINKITGGDEKFNNAVLRPALDLKNNDLFRNPQPITLLFNDVERFYQQNPIIGKLASQINVSKLSNEDLTKRQLFQGEISKIEDRLYNLKYGKSDKKKKVVMIVTMMMLVKNHREGVVLLQCEKQKLKLTLLLDHHLKEVKKTFKTLLEN